MKEQQKHAELCLKMNDDLRVKIRGQTNVCCIVVVICYMLPDQEDTDEIIKELEKGFLYRPLFSKGT